MNAESPLLEEVCLLVLKVLKEITVFGWARAFMSLVTGAFPLTSCDVRSLIALALFQVMGPVAVLLLVDPSTLLVAFLGI